MPKAKAKGEAKAKVKAKSKRAPRKMVLRLYVAGTSDRSMRAILNARAMLDEHAAGNYTLEVIDLFQQPTLARDDQIVAVPTLIKRLPAPLQRFIGDLSDGQVTIVGLDLRRR
jgi:circadian clock protein KaiB